MAKRDYYEVLGVARHASSGEIRRTFRRLARQYSPDVNVWDERAAGLFDEIVEAFRVLNDGPSRTLYDRFGHRALEPPSDRDAVSVARGEDLHYPIEIEFEEALRGVTAVLELSRQDPCPACQATGGAGGHRATRCPTCDGQPVRIVVHQGTPVSVRCEACAATGWHLPEPCADCGGRGVVTRQVRVPVSIPPGVDTGAQVRVPGEGHAAPAPARRGHLVVITRVRSHPFFTRKGDNLYCEVPISVPEAALGARIQIPTPGGPRVVTIPRGTQSGQILRIRGKGCPRLDREGCGDLLVATQVVIPRNADSTLEAVLRALQRLLPEDPRAGLFGPGGATG